MLKVEQRRAGDCLTVRVKGELDCSTTAVLRTALVALGDDQLVIVDLREVPFMDSAGLGAVIGGIRRLRDHGNEVAICAGPGPVQRVLAVSGFDRIVPTYSSIKEARVALGAVLASPEVAPS